MRAKRLSLFMVSICFILVFASLSLVAGCAAPAPAPTPAPAPAPTPAPAPAPAPTPTPAPAPKPTPAPTPTPAPAPTKVYKFKFTDQYTSQMAAGIQAELLGKIISERTGGRVEITYFHSESLGKTPDFINMLNAGIVDIIYNNPAYYPGQFDMALGLEIPMGIPSREVRLAITWELYNKGYFKGLADFKVLAFNATPLMTIFLKEKAETVADLNGRKIRCSDASVRKMLELAGASTVTIPGSEVYMSLDRGVIDGTATMDESFIQMKQYEVAKYVVWEPKLSSGCSFIIMSKDAWSTLPADLQADVDKAIEDYKTEFLRVAEDVDKNSPEILRKEGVELISFSPEEAAKLLALADPIKEEWIAAREAKGLPAREMMDLVKELVAKYK